MNAEWDAQFSRLEAYYKANKAWPSPGVMFPEGNPLGDWCEAQRRAFKEGTLDNQYFLKLHNVAFSFMTDQEKWELQYRFFEEYVREQRGSYPEFEIEYPEGNFLGRWSAIQQQRYRDNEMEPWQRERCDLHPGFFGKEST